jgi:uncharacterized membrane protein
MWLVSMTMAMAQVAAGADCTRSCIAWGEAPRWSIRDGGGRWSLHVAGRAPLPLVPGRWQDTPRGRQLTGTAGSGRFTLLATFGACGESAGSSRSPARYFATLTLPDGRVLRGCVVPGYTG